MSRPKAAGRYPGTQEKVTVISFFRCHSSWLVEEIPREVRSQKAYVWPHTFWSGMCWDPMISCCLIIERELPARFSLGKIFTTNPTFWEKGSICSPLQQIWLINKASTRSVQGNFMRSLDAAWLQARCAKSSIMMEMRERIVFIFATTLRNFTVAKVCLGGAIPSNKLDLLKA